MVELSVAATLTRPATDTTSWRLAMHPQSTHARFWSKVDKSGECWIWTAALNGAGYGVFRLKDHNSLAHRFAYECLVGPIPAGMQVCHHCDNPPCVRPEHLFVGTHQDNMADMHAKGRRSYEGQVWPQPTYERRARGERQGKAILTEQQVREIRAVYHPRVFTRPMLAERYHVSVATIKQILSGRSWKHVR